MAKRRSLDDLVREFETTDMGDKLALMPEVHFTVSKKERGIMMVIPPKLVKIVRELIAIAEPPKRRRSKAA